MIILGTQLWLWTQEPRRPTVQTFCMEETANQKKLGLKGEQSQRESGLKSLFHIADRLSGSKKPSPH